MVVEVRTAHPVDVEEILGLWRVAGENATRPVDSAEAVSALIRRDPDALMLAHDDGRLVGSVVAGWDGWRAHLYRLAVHPDARRRGIAHLLLDRAERRLVALGAIRIDAMVLDGNELGGALWTARGYVRQAEWGRWVRPVRDGGT